MAKIPHDIISDILLLLPIKSLVRFRSLSKPICSAIDDPDFIKRQLEYSLKTRSNLTLFLRDWNIYAADYDTVCSSFNVEPGMVDHPLHKGGGTEAVGSCNGLLALRNSERDLALYNHATKKLKRLPVSEIDPPDRFAKTGYVFYGFGYDSVNDDYKFVRMATFVSDTDRCESFEFEYEVKVYSLKTDKWKRIKGLPQYLRLLHKPFYQVLHRRGYGVYACNALHWAMPHWPEFGVKNSIVAFDLVTETFREVPPPECVEKRLSVQIDVGALEGNLCAMCNYGHECIDLWVMEYGVKESWSKLFSFRVTKSIGSLMFLRPIGYSKDGDKILLEVNDHKIAWYDWNKPSLRTVKMQNGPKSFGAELCVGSLVPLDDGDEIARIEEDERQREMRQANRRMRDDFLSVGFKLKL